MPASHEGPTRRYYGGVVRLVKWLAVGLAVGLPLALLTTVALAVSSTPFVQGREALTPSLVLRAEQLLREHNPRRVRTGQLRVAEIAGDDVNLMASYAASRLGLAMAVEVRDGQAVVRTSVPIPRSPVGGYLNITAVIPESAGVPRPTHVTVGRVSMPDAVANWMLRYVLRRLSPPEGEQLAADMIRSVSMPDGRLRVEYRWRNDTADRMRALAVPADDAERLRAYHERIANVVRALPPERRSMLDLLVPLMELARVRSSAGGDPIVENRAALIAAAFYVNNVGMAAVVADAERWPRARTRTLLLRGRGDLTRHFLVSAVLTATAGTPLSDVVGLSKEIEDSRGGSGFSFSDLAADRAGTAFGALAVGDARRLQDSMSGATTEDDLMPAITGLVDNMPEAEFNARFGGIDSPAYREVLAEIDRRVGACRLYRGA